MFTDTTQIHPLILPLVLFPRRPCHDGETEGGAGRREQTRRLVCETPKTTRMHVIDFPVIHLQLFPPIESIVSHNSRDASVNPVAPDEDLTPTSTVSLRCITDRESDLLSGC